MNAIWTYNVALMVDPVSPNILEVIAWIRLFWSDLDGNEEKVSIKQKGNKIASLDPSTLKFEK